MNVLDLFSGIGGFSLGLERAGMRTVAFCEIDPFCQRVLAKHWPNVPIYDDVRTLTANRLRTDGIAVDVICGGFPCQDLSIAQGKARAGLDGKRSGLWTEYARLIRELGPRYIIVENVPGLLSLGVGTVLKDLASIGYDAEWQVISAAAVGAPHIRDRFWLVGYPNRNGEPIISFNDGVAWLPRLAANADSVGCNEMEQSERSREKDERPVFAALHASLPRGWAWWSSEPNVGRVADGVPARVDRLRALGNAVVPQVAEWIGRRLMEVA